MARKELGLPVEGKEPELDQRLFHTILKGCENRVLTLWSKSSTIYQSLMKKHMLLDLDPDTRLIYEHTLHQLTVLLGALVGELRSDDVDMQHLTVLHSKIGVLAEQLDLITNTMSSDQKSRLAAALKKKAQLGKEEAARVEQQFQSVMAQI